LEFGDADAQLAVAYWERCKAGNVEEFQGNIEGGTKAKTIEDFIITTERVNSFSPAIKPSAYQPRMLSPQSRCFPLLREFGL
jgi:hypothetical protein